MNALITRLALWFLAAEGEALGETLRRDGIELVLGATVSAARRAGEDYVLELTDGRELRCDRLLVAAAVGATADRFTATVRLADIAKTAAYMRTECNGYLTLLSDGERLTGAHTLGPEAGEWLQQATLATRARIPLDVLTDTIEPFPTFSEIYLAGLKVLHGEIATARAPQVAS